jgi:alkyldihydroxyacetonephosphate synthase
VAPRSAAGPDWKHLLLGGRGVTGRISAAVLRVHRLPEAVIPVAYEVSSSSRAIRSLAHLLHRGAIPAVAAIVPSAGGYTLLLTFEGHPALSQARADIAARTCSEVAAEALGEEPVRRWLASVGGEGGTPVSSPLLMQPTLRREGGWSVLAAMLEAVRGRRGVEACVTHVRHAAASMLVYAPEKSEREVAGIAAAIDAAGGVSPSAGPASGAVGAWLVGERPASIPGA